GEHQGRIVTRHERTGGHQFMSASAEELQETRSNFVDAAHERLALRTVFPVRLLEHGGKRRQREWRRTADRRRRNRPQEERRRTPPAGSTAARTTGRRKRGARAAGGSAALARPSTRDD